MQDLAFDLVKKVHTKMEALYSCVEHYNNLSVRTRESLIPISTRGWLES